MDIECLKCKGRGHCGRTFCAVQAKFNSRMKVKEILPEKSFQSISPAPFVGRVGYPNVNLGILAPPEKSDQPYDAPRNWAKSSLDIQSIIDLRSSLINSRRKINVFGTDKGLGLAQEIAMAKKPVDVEVELQKKPTFSLNVDSTMAPYGPNAELKKLDITENPKVNVHVEKAVSDTDLKSVQAVRELYAKGIDENYLSKILSVGTLGLKKNRKLVPTRWSITAVDDTVGKDVIREIKDYQISDYQAFFGDYLGNYYLFLFFPEVWHYELFESYLGNFGWNQSNEIAFSTDYEGYSGRKTYAENCAGGYYACRLAVAEKLKSMKRQSGVLALRFITGDYVAPLGVWVCREASRIALSNRPISFSTRELMLEYAKILIKKKFNFDITFLLEKSIFLKELKKQRKLGDFG